MACRDCEHLNVKPNAAGRRVPRKGNAYPCTFPVPPVVLPDSITRSRDFQWPPHRSFMCPEDGENCPCYKKIGG